MPCRSATIASGLILTTLLFAAGPVPAAESGLPRVAVAAFDYSDSSGEPRDQSAEHLRRVAEFRTELENRLASSRRFAPVSLPCLAGTACSAATTPPDDLIDEAKSAGAQLLVFGSIHKMSTLVGWGRIDVVDVATGKLLFDHIISFRGDNDDAFVRAADFAAKDIARTLAPVDTAAETETSARGIR